MYVRKCSEVKKGSMHMLCTAYYPIFILSYSDMCMYPYVCMYVRAYVGCLYNAAFHEITERGSVVYEVNVVVATLFTTADTHMCT